MQIFLLDYNLVLNAQYLDNVHLNKQILECVQILKLALHYHHSITLPNINYERLKTYKNNPLVLFCKDNLFLCLKYLECCLNEYFLRTEIRHAHSLDYKIIKMKIDPWYNKKVRNNPVTFPLTKSICRLLFNKNENINIPFSSVVNVHQVYWNETKLCDKNGKPYKYTLRDVPYFTKSKGFMRSNTNFDFYPKIWSIDNEIEELEKLKKDLLAAKHIADQYIKVGGVK